MDAPEFPHKRFPHARPPLFQELCADGEFVRSAGVPAPPCAHLDQQWHKLNRRLREAVDRLLPMRGVAAAREEPHLDKAGEPVGQDVRGDGLLGMAKQLPERTAISKHYIADDDQTPRVTQYFQRQIDGASGALDFSSHATISACIMQQVRAECIPVA